MNEIVFFSDDAAGIPRDARLDALVRELRRIGIESTGTYGAGLLRFMQKAGVEVLEVTAPDKLDRRRRGKDDDLEAQNAAHAAFAGKRTVTPRSRDRLRSMSRMQLVRTLAAWRPDLTACRDVEAAYRISLKSHARRYLELHDEIADLDAMMGAIVRELAPTSSPGTRSGTSVPRSFCSRLASCVLSVPPRQS